MDINDQKNALIADLEKRAEYWEKRCRAAEDFIKESPCDPDITYNQIQAHNKWQDFKNKGV